MQTTERGTRQPDIEPTRPLEIAPEPERLRRVYVWQLPVRAVHWIIFLSIVILSVTGYYLHNPFIFVDWQRGYFLATMRFIHEVTAFVFTLAFLTRIYWMFMGNQFSRWRAFVPVSRKQWRSIREMLKYYLFLRWRAPDEVGHNSLAALAYLGIFTLFLIQILTGFALYSNVVGTGIWHTLFGWLPGVMNIRYQREIHFFIMFLLIGFTVHHIYSAWLVSNETQNGTLGSIFSGYKFLNEKELKEAGLSQPAATDGSANGKTNGAPVPSTIEAESTVIATGEGEVR